MIAMKPVATGVDFEEVEALPVLSNQQTIVGREVEDIHTKPNTEDGCLQGAMERRCSFGSFGSHSRRVATKAALM